MKDLPPRPVSYPNRSQLAAELAMSESTVDEMVRRGVLPKPLKLSTGCVRWCWEDVKAALAKLAQQPDDADPFLAGIRNASKVAPEGRRAAS